MYQLHALATPSSIKPVIDLEARIEALLPAAH